MGCLKDGLADRCFNRLTENVNEGWHECGLGMEWMVCVVGCGDEERNKRG